MAQTRGHQHGASGHKVARTEHVGRPRACSENNMNMISFITLMNVFNFY